MARSTVCHRRDARGKEGKEKRKEKGNKDRDREIRENEGGEKEKEGGREERKGEAGGKRVGAWTGNENGTQKTSKLRKFADMAMHWPEFLPSK